MKARFKGDKTKEITISGETVSFPSGQWTVLPTIAFYNRIKSLPSLFDLAHDYDIQPFLKYGKYIRFGKKTISSDHKPTIRALDQMKILTRQARLPEKGIVIYRINCYSEVYLDGFVSLKSQVKVLCKRHKGGIGDIIMTLPAMEAIKNKYPNYVIDYACPKFYMPLLENVPFIQSVFDVDKFKNEFNYDIVYDMTRKCIQYEGKTQPNVDLNRTEIFATVVDIPREKIPRTKLYLSDSEVGIGVCLDFVQTAAQGALVSRELPSNDKLLIGVCVNSSAPVRSFMYADELIEKLSTKYPKALILFFQEKETYTFSQNNVIIFTNFKLRDIMVIINRCDIFIGPDTGLTHIAASLRVQTLWLFTHVDGNIRTRGYDTSEIVQVTPPACMTSRPCWYLFPCNPMCGEKTDGPHCVKSLSAEIVMDKVGSILSFPLLSTLILCHNRFDLTFGCINRILRIKKFNDELILIDNGSEDETFGMFSNLKAEKFYYYRKNENTGCVVGRNFGLKQCQGLFIWLLDNDQFINDYTLQRIMQIEGDFVGVEGWFINSEGNATQYSKCGKLNYIGAGGLFTRLSKIESIDYFDENYNPAWFEDPDLCFKATERGYTLGLCENAGVQHFPHSTNHSQSDFDSSEIWKRNRKYFVNKWKHLQTNLIVSIVILTHNDSETTIRCMNSIYQNTKLEDFEIIVVDNGSNEEEVVKLVGFQRQNLLYIFSQNNLMVAAGRNLGAKKAKGEFILFLDNDMIIEDKWLEKIVENVDRNDCVATAPKVIDIHKGNKEVVRFVGTVIKDGAIHEVFEDCVFECDFLLGGALFVNRKIFEQFPFDEKFVFGVEDYDWFMRVREAGYRFFNTPSVTFLHAKMKQGRTITPYDNAERERKGSSFIEDSIRLFLYRYKNKLPNQWKKPGWLQWAIGRNNEINNAPIDLVYAKIKDEVEKLYPDETLTER